MDAPLAALLNLGPYSARLLADVGIHTEADLRRVGAVGAYRQIAFHRSGDVSLLLLYALEGALTGVRWDALDEPTRARLRAAADPSDDAEHEPSPSGPARPRSRGRRPA